MGIPALALVRHMEYNEDRQGYEHPGYTYSRCWKCPELFIHARGVSAECIKDCGSHDCGKMAA